MLPDQNPPPGWPKPKRRFGRVLTAGFLGVLAALMALVVAAAITTGDLLQAVTYGLGAVLLGHGAGMAINMVRSHRPAGDPPGIGTTDENEQGIAFSYSRWSYYWLSMVLGSTGLLAAGFAAVSATNGTPAGWAIAIVAALFAAFDGWFLIVMLRLAPGVVVLTPTGIYHRSLTLEHFAPWDAVVDVLAQEGQTPWITVKVMPMSGMRERKHTGRLGAFEAQFLPFMVVRTMWLGANAVPTYSTLRYYFDHPDERRKLGGIGRSADR
jgi:MFS family permease